MTVMRLSLTYPQLGLDGDILRHKFLEYQLQDDAEMPKHLQVDKFRSFMGQKKIAGERIFSYLATLTKSLLCISHSNVFSERTLSVMRKIVTVNRTSSPMTLCARCNLQIKL